MVKKTKHIEALQKMTEGANLINKVLTNPYRIKIINFVDLKPRTVTEIKEHLGISLKSTIGNLNVLENFNVITKKPEITKKGKVVLVSLSANKEKLGERIYQEHVGVYAEKLGVSLPALKETIKDIEKKHGVRKKG